MFLYELNYIRSFVLWVILKLPFMLPVVDTPRRDKLNANRSVACSQSIRLNAICRFLLLKWKHAARLVNGRVFELNIVLG